MLRRNAGNLNDEEAVIYPHTKGAKVAKHISLVEPLDTGRCPSQQHLQGVNCSARGLAHSQRLLLAVVQSEQEPPEPPLTRPSATLSPSDGERDGVRGCE